MSVRSPRPHIPRLTDAEKVNRLKAIVKKHCDEKEQRDTLAIMSRAEGRWSSDTIETALSAFEDDFGYKREDPIT